MKKLINCIKNHLPWNVDEVHVGTDGFTVVCKKDQSKQVENVERGNLAIAMKALSKKIISNPKTCAIDKPPYRLQYWANNNLIDIEIPYQIEAENWSNWLTKEEKEKFQRICDLLKEHNEFVKKAKNEDPKFDGKHPRKVYDSYMGNLLQLTDEYDEK